MDYEKIYKLLVLKRKQQEPADYCEKHHIKPRALGGDNSKANIVKLTAREHFIAHRLLAKIHGGSMWYALSLMMRDNTKSAKGVKVTSRTYEIIKRNNARVRSERMAGARNPFYGKTFTPEQLEKLKGERPSVSGENNPNYGISNKTKNELISFTNRYKPRLNIDYSVHDKINGMLGIVTSNNRRGRLKPKPMKKLACYYRGFALTAEGRDYSGDKNPNYGNGQAISGSKNPMYGKKQKTSTKAKIAEKAKRRIKCPHCEKEGNIANMHRWHLDNCKALK